MAYGNPYPEHPIKLIKGLVSPPDVAYTTAQAGRLFMKLLVEFWGFCINGTDDLYLPGGLAPVSATILPASLLSGSGTLLAVGTDGHTDFGGNTFGSNQNNFLSFGTGSLLNKYLVAWKPGSDSVDDSVYRIIGVDDETHLRIDVATGGTTRLGGKAAFAARDGIRYRIIDPNAAVSLAEWSNTSTRTQGVVLSFNGASAVNPGQASPQLGLFLTSSQAQITIQASPSGTWTGTAFTDAPSAITQSWFASGAAGQGCFYISGGPDYLMCHIRGTDGAWSTVSPAPGLHAEVPSRLQPAHADPNPFVWCAWTSSPGAGGLSPVTGAYGTGLFMVNHLGSASLWRLTCRTPTACGDAVHLAITPQSGGLWYGLSRARAAPGARIHYSHLSGTYMTSDAVLSSSDQGYVAARARLRRARFTARDASPNLRLGERWVHVGGGVLWPWDGSLVPYGLFWDGGGAQPASEEG